MRLVSAMLILAVLIGVSPAEAQRARPPAAPDPALVAAVQQALILDGETEPTLSGRLDPPTLAALRRFQTKSGIAASGALDPATLVALRAVHARAEVDLAISLQVDAETGFAVPVPLGRLPKREDTDTGARFVSTDGTVTLETAIFPGRNASLANVQRDISAGKTVVSARADTRGLLLVLRDGETVETWRALMAGGRVAAVMLSHPVGASDVWRTYKRLLDLRTEVATATRVPAPAWGHSVPVPVARGIVQASLTATAKPQDTATATSGPVVATLSLVADPLDARGRPGRPVVEIRVEGQSALRFDIEDRAEDWTLATVSLVELDAGNRTPEVVLTVVDSDDGCCTLGFVFSANATGTWAARDAGPWLDAPRFLADPVRAGGFVIAGELAAFHQAFGAKAGARAPLSVLRFFDGAFIDATREAGFAAIEREQLIDLWGTARSAGFRPNGIWPGLVAAARIAGQGDAMTALMTRLHDRAETSGRTICRQRLPVEQCPPSDRVTRSFPDALEAFLREAGF
jgi:hypothetical protein